MKNTAFIPLRGGSKGIPRKNIKPLAGKPLFCWVALAALRADGIDEVVISTDDEEIKSLALAMNEPKLRVFGRSPETATDTASTELAMLEYAEKSDADRIILIQATSPLLRSIDLENGLKEFKATGADSLLSVVRQKRFLWQKNDRGFATSMNYRPDQRPRRQDFEGYLVENGAFYICSREQLLETGCRLHGKIAVCEMPEESYVELDEPSDWGFLSGLLSKRESIPAPSMEPEELSANVIEKARSIKLFLTDVDGTLTDAGMYYSENGDELKKFNTRDAVGMRLLQEAGIKVGFMTSEKTELVAWRAKKTKIDILVQGARNKREELETVLRDTEFDVSEVAFIGDDLNDVEILSQVGLSGAPQNACEAVQSQVDFISNVRGGEGAVREFADFILRAKKAAPGGVL